MCGGATTLLICGMLLFTSCDSSFVPDVESLPSEEASNRIQVVQEWCKIVLAGKQSALPVLPNGGTSKAINDGKIAAVLAAMVRECPLD